MTGRDGQTCVCAAEADARQQRIRKLNDDLRRYGRGGVTFVTAGIRSLGPPAIGAVIAAVRAFDDFTANNDPYREHDLGVMKLGRIRVMWKIDYYDRDRRFGSSDPSDSAVTARVLTILLAEEY